MSPVEIPLTGWQDIAWRVYAEIGNDRLLAVAAGVVFYGLLALFPAITALVSSYALFAEAATIGKHLAFAAALMPGGAYGIVEEQITRIAQGSSGGLSTAFLLGLAARDLERECRHEGDDRCAQRDLWRDRGAQLRRAQPAVARDDARRPGVSAGRDRHRDRAAARLRLDRHAGLRRMGDRDAALACDHDRDRAWPCSALSLRPEPARGAVAMAERRRRGCDLALGRGIGTVLAGICRTSPITTRPMVRSAPASA